MKRTCPACKAKSIGLFSPLGFSVTCPECKREIEHAGPAARLMPMVPMLIYPLWTNLARPDVRESAWGLALAVAGFMVLYPFARLRAIGKPTGADSPRDSAAVSQPRRE